MKNEGQSAGIEDAHLRRIAWSSSGSPSYSRLILGIVFAMLVIFSIFARNFLTVRSLLNLLLQTSTFTILGIGSMLVLLAGGVDFSLGAVVALSGAAVVRLAGTGMPIALAMVAAVGMGGIAGLANGLLVVRMRLPSLITTFAMAILLRGLLGFAATRMRPGPVPNSLGNLANIPVLRILSQDSTGATHVAFPGISWIVIIMVFTATAFHLMLTKTRIGRYARLAGTNPVASRFSGIPVNRVRTTAFVLAGILAGLVGILLASRMVGSPGPAAGYETIGIACAMIGGASLSGGRGSVVGTVIGSFIISTLGMGLTMMNANNLYLPVLLDGFVILGAVYLDQMRMRY
ncbi:MAG TPA: ABC transporter permease [Rectinemataceae bacterium]|nr:ABC transporter permease [Rectinemataceae bacterium]